MTDRSAGPKVLGLIPARGGSKGIRHKNIAPLGGRPLIAYTIEAARESVLLTDYIVSTDSEAIAEVSRGLGATVPFLRPPPLATDEARSLEVALHSLDHYRTEAQFDYLLLLQPTEPLRTAEDIDASIRLAVAHQARSVVSFTVEETRHPYYMYFIEAPAAPGGPPRVRQAFDYEVGTPRQQFPPAAFRNGAIYLVQVPFLRDRRSFVSPDMVPYFMPSSRSVNIDTREDLCYAEFLLSGGPGEES